MRLVTIARPPSGRAGAVIGDEVVDFAMLAMHAPIARWVPPGLAEAIAGGDEAVAILRRLADLVAGASTTLAGDLRESGALTPLATTRLAAPIPRPTLLLSHARAYRDHVAEMNKGEAPPPYPIGFTKSGHSVIGPGAPIHLPADAARMVDFEGEISVVFARPCHGVTQDEAMGCVLGVTIVNDVSARDWVPEMKTAPDRNRMGKQFPGFAPMGPWISTCDELADMHDLHLVTRVNGAVMQDAWTRDLIWPLPALIEYYSRWYAFQPGDILTTGSPAGVGYGRDPKQFLKPGDSVDITVDGLGTLTNPVAAPSAEVILATSRPAGAAFASGRHSNGSCPQSNERRVT